MTLIEFIDSMYIESNRTIKRKDTGEVVEYKNLNDKERNPWRYAAIDQIEEPLELLFDLPGFVPGLPSEQLEDFQVRTTIPYEEARMRLKLIHDEISAAYRSAKKNNKNIVFSKWAEDSFEGMDPYKKIVGFRDVYFREYAYDLADSGLSTVLYRR